MTGPMRSAPLPAVTTLKKSSDALPTIEVPKDDPESYARRTVTKAQVELDQRLVKADGGVGHAPQSIDNSQDRSGRP